MCLFKPLATISPIIRTANMTAAKPGMILFQAKLGGIVHNNNKALKYEINTLESLVDFIVLLNFII